MWIIQNFFYSNLRCGLALNLSGKKQSHKYERLDCMIGQKEVLSDRNRLRMPR